MVERQKKSGMRSPDQSKVSVRSSEEGRDKKNPRGALKKKGEWRVITYAAVE